MTYIVGLLHGRCRRDRFPLRNQCCLPSTVAYRNIGNNTPKPFKISLFSLTRIFVSILIIQKRILLKKTCTQLYTHMPPLGD